MLESNSHLNIYRPTCNSQANLIRLVSLASEWAHGNPRKVRCFGTHFFCSLLFLYHKSIFCSALGSVPKSKKLWIAWNSDQVKQKDNFKLYLNPALLKLFGNFGNSTKSLTVTTGHKKYEFIYLACCRFGYMYFSKSSALHFLTKRQRVWSLSTIPYYL